MFQYTLVFSYHFEFLTPPLVHYPGESDHVSYMTDKSSCSIYPLYAALGHICVVLIVQGLYPMSDLSPDPIIVISVIYLCFPSFAQFLVTLVIRWRICCLPYHSMVPFSVLLDGEDLAF